MPLTTEQYQKSLAQPPLCEQLKVRDLTDNLLIQLNGSFVAGYRVSGIHSYYASDEERNRTKLALEALIRSLPERSMRLQVRFEIAEGDGGSDRTLQPGTTQSQCSSAGSRSRTVRRLVEEER